MSGIYKLTQRAHGGERIGEYSQSWAGSLTFTTPQEILPAEQPVLISRLERAFTSRQFDTVGIYPALTGFSFVRADALSAQDQERYGSEVAMVITIKYRSSYQMPTPD